MAETTEEHLQQNKTNESVADEKTEIRLDDKLFKFNFKQVVRNPVIIILIGLVISFSAILVLNYLANERVMKNYRHTLLFNVARRLNDVKDEESIEKIVKETVNDKWVKTVFVCNKDGNLISHSIESVENQFKNKKLGNKYDFIFNHLWMFNVEGKPIPYEKTFTKEFSVVSSFPVYDKDTKIIKYVLTISFDRFIYKPTLLKYKKLPYYLSFIEIGVILFLLMIIISLIIFFILKGHFKGISKKLRYILLNLHKVDVHNLPQKIEYNEDKFGKEIIGEYIKFANELLDKAFNRIKEERERGEKLRSVIPPLIMRSSLQDGSKVVLREASLNLCDELWKKYFADNSIADIEDYSIGMYHFNKNEPNLVFKSIDIDAHRKGFFVGEIKEEDSSKKAFLLTFINYFLNNRLENIDSTSGYLLNMNNILNRTAKSEMKLNAMYAVLNNETNYFEVSSTNIEPLILYMAEDREATYYQFKGLKVGEKWGDDFLKSLKKEGFKLNSDDTIVIMNKSINHLKNFDNDEYEMQNIVQIIHSQFPLSADVLVDKIKNSLKDFSVDFSKNDDLIVLAIKKNQDE